MPPPGNGPTAPAKPRLATLNRSPRGCRPRRALPTLPSRARWHALLGQAHQALETTRDELQA